MTADVLKYYASLLIMQYSDKPRAVAMIQAILNIILLPDFNYQVISFTTPPVSGTFKLQFNGVKTIALAWNASNSAMTSALNSILPAPMTVDIGGDTTTGLTFTFSNYTTSTAGIVTLTDSTMLNLDGQVVQSSSVPFGEQLAVEVQNAFNIFGTNPAVGKQLDVIGKYVGVTRSGVGFDFNITLNDEDFLTFIQMGIVRNRSGSSLLTIQLLLHQFFPNEVYVFDYQNMQMSYLIDSNLGSNDLIDLFVTEGLLPRPMGVGLSVIAAPIIDKFFGFRTYAAPASALVTPFNTYAAYDSSWIWVSYQDSVLI